MPANGDKAAKLREVRLYVLLTSAIARGPIEEVAAEVLEAGAHAIQLREKHMADREFLEAARHIRALCDRHGALMIVNDRADIAVLSGADGVHLGQDDLPAADVRKLVGPDMIIGLSTHNAEQVESAQSCGADYIGIGPVFQTATKGYDAGLGVRKLGGLTGRTPLPTVAIGGIRLENVADVIKAGFQGVAVCSAIIADADPSGATRCFLNNIRSAVRG